MGIVVSIIYLYVSEPALLVTNSCNFISGLYCQEIALMTNTVTHNTTAVLFFTNSNPYPLNGISSYARINNMNTTSGQCYPSNVAVPTGGQVSCLINLNANTQLNSFIAGTVYVNATYCGLSLSYQASQNCSVSAAEIETYKGSFAGHTQQVIPEVVTFATSQCGVLSGNVATINGLTYSCNSLLATQFPYNRGQTIAFSFVNPDRISSGEKGVFSKILLYNTSYPSNTGTIVVVRNDKFVFNYTIQYSLTESASGSGGVLLPNDSACYPSSCVMWYNSNSAVQISESPPGSGIFVGWVGTGTGSYTGNSATATVTMSNSITEIAYFGSSHHH